MNFDDTKSKISIGSSKSSKMQGSMSSKSITSKAKSIYNMTNFRLNLICDC